MKVYVLTAIRGGRVLLAVNEDIAPLREKAIELAKAKWGEVFYFGLDQQTAIGISKAKKPGSDYDIQVGAIELNSMSRVNDIIDLFKMSGSE